MADYRFIIACWQDKVGSENALATVTCNGAEVLTNVAVASEDVNSPTFLKWESTGLAEPNANGSVAVDIKVKLTNNEYVDENTDRNVWIGDLRYSIKGLNESGASNYYFIDFNNGNAFTVQNDTDNVDQYNSGLILPTAVTGDQIDENFWTEALADGGEIASSGQSGSFYYIPVYGGDDGVTITMPLKYRCDKGQ